MRFHHKRAFWIIRILPALLLALLLCACGNGPQTSVGTLPAIGIPDLDPDKILTPTQGSTEAPAESSDAAAESTKASENTVSSETAETPEAAVPTEEESTEEPTEATEEPEMTEEPTKSASAGYRVWIGDSRFAGIHDGAKIDSDHDYFICSWGAGYSWMVNTAIPAFNTFAASHQVDVVYWSLGASDVAQTWSSKNYTSGDKYAAELNKLTDKYPNITFYILSYGPVGGDGKKPSGVSDVDKYLSSLKSFMSYVFSHTNYTLYIDLVSYIESIGYTTSDGFNYDAATNQKIYDYILSKSGQK
ncbi:MAG: SGNH/GDSL hydrolase family protein [Lachnospiraceae bacterium]|nr:SGNH/GDSL hydrolase family protein [Lachnospiraceae bacterium]